MFLSQHIVILAVSVSDVQHEYACSKRFHVVGVGENDLARVEISEFVVLVDAL